MVPFLSRVASVGVGVFALWQMVFLLSANVMNFVPRQPGPGDTDPPRHAFQEYGTFTKYESLQTASDHFGAVLDFWSEMSGEEQGWRMFVPGSPSCSHFFAIVVRFKDGHAVELRSDFEPTDLSHPAPRWPMIHNRAFNFEIAISLYPYYGTPDALERYPEIWARELPKSVRANHSMILAWLQWRTAKAVAEHPGHGEVEEVILKSRYIPIPKPHGPPGWEGPIVERNYARWRPRVQPDPGYLALEACDPITGTFTRLREDGAP